MGPYHDGRKLTRVRFDGLEVAELHVPMAHHDFVELPDGTLATLQFDLLPTDEGEVYGDRLVEIDPQGNETEIWRTWDAREFRWEDVHEGASRWGHANALDYDEGADTYHVSVLYFDTIFEIDRATGETLSRIGGDDGDYELADDAQRWFDGQHQFEVLDEGLLVFDNGPNGFTQTRVAEYSLDDPSGTATLVWEHAHDPPLGIYAFGDASRLHNGNTLVTWSSAGRTQQVTPDGDVVWSVSADLGAGFGYADWVSSLYE